MSRYRQPQPSAHHSPAPGPKGRLRTLRSPVIILIIYTLLTLFLTHPLLFHLTSVVPNDIGDPLLNTWILAWDSHALLTDPLNLFKANIFYPLPNTLAYSEHLFSTALLALPIQLIFAEPIATYNLSLLASFPLAAFGMYLLSLRWTGQRSAAFIAGLIFAFAPYRFAAIAHLQLLTFQWLPFILLSLDLLLIRPETEECEASLWDQRPVKSLLWPLVLTIFLLLQLLASWYLALYTLLIIGIYLLAALLTRRLNHWQLVQLGFVFLFSIILILPFAWPYFSLLADLRAARPISLALSLAASPTDFAAAAPFNRFFGPLTESLRTRPSFTEENTLFMGFLTPALALISVAFLAMGAYSAWSPLFIKRTTPCASRLTPHVLLAILLLSLSLTFAAPYTLLAQLIPTSTIIRVPSRWIIPALFSLAGLAVFGYATLLRLNVKRSTFNVLCVLLLLAETFSAPLPLASVENHASLNPAYSWLARRPGDLALIELPLHSAPAPEYPEVKRLYASTLGWWKLINGYSGYTPARQPKLAQALADFPGPNSIAALQNLASPTNLPTFLLVHPGEAPFDRTRWETTTHWQAERNPTLLPIDQFAGDYLYQILPPDPTRFTTPLLATFGQDQSIQLLTYQLSVPDPQSKIQNPKSKMLLYWRSLSPLSTDYTLFIHFRAADGFVRSQADGPPVSGHYPTTTWQPGEIIQDIHPLPEADLNQADHLAIGLYDPISGERLPAFGPDGNRLADETLIVSP